MLHVPFRRMHVLLLGGVFQLFARFTWLKPLFKSCIHLLTFCLILSITVREASKWTVISVELCIHFPILRFCFVNFEPLLLGTHNVHYYNFLKGWLSDYVMSLSLAALFILKYRLFCLVLTPGLFFYGTLVCIFFHLLL